MKKTFQYQDLHPSFEINPITKDFSILTDEKSIRFQIKSLIMTNFYERPFNPDFGGNLVGSLFELATENTAAILQFTLKELLDTYEPRIEVGLIHVFLAPDKNALEVSVNYTIKNSTRTDSVNLILKRTR